MTTLPEWAKWLARDESGDLYAYSVKPLKADDFWRFENLEDKWIGIEETDDTFSHVKWTDEEPTPVGMIIQAFHDCNEPPTMDAINQPNHYKGKHGIETIEIIQNFATDEMEMGFYWGNAIKYMTRYRSKNGLEDLKKARKNIDWLIEHTEG